MHHNVHDRFGVDNSSKNCRPLEGGGATGFSTTNANHPYLIFGQQQNVLPPNIQQATPLAPALSTSSGRGGESLHQLLGLRPNNPLQQLHPRFLSLQQQHHQTGRSYQTAQQPQQLSSQLMLVTQAMPVSLLESAAAAVDQPNLHFQQHLRLQHVNSQEQQEEAAAGIMLGYTGQLSATHNNSRAQQEGQLLEHIRNPPSHTMGLRTNYGQEAALGILANLPQELQLNQQVFQAEASALPLCAAFPFQVSATAAQQKRQPEHRTSMAHVREENLWTSDETEALLRTCSQMIDRAFGEGFDMTMTRQLWDEVSRKLQMMGFNVTAKACMEKYHILKDDESLHRKDSEKHVLVTTSSSFHVTNRIIDRNANENSGTSCSMTNNSRPQNNLQPCTVAATCTTAPLIAGHFIGQARTTESLSQGCESLAETKLATSDEEAEDDEEVEVEDKSADEDDNVLVGETDGENKEGRSPRGDEGQQDTKKKNRKKNDDKRFFERLTWRIMEKQEALHKSFLEMIERRERERVLREEAQRQQEVARLEREQQIRAQEVVLTAARDAALIDFLQKAAGEDLHVCALSPADVAAKLGVRYGSENNHSEINQVGLRKLADQDQIMMDGNSAANMVQAEVDGMSEQAIHPPSTSRRWPKVEVHALIRLRSGMEPRFREAGPKAHLWQEISASMACMGFSRSPRRCKEKWENINKYFKKTKDSSRKRPENAKTCPYFHQLDALYQRGILVSTGSAPLSTGGYHKQHAGADAQAPLLEYHGPPTSTITSASQSILTAPSSSSFKNSTLIPTSKKSLQVEMFVKDILELQQQQHQKLLDEYDRMEQAQELRELAADKQNTHVSGHEPEGQHTEHVRTTSPLSHHRRHGGDSPIFMALV